jgi:hypothetical protein
MNEEKIAQIINQEDFLTDELNRIIDQFHREPRRLDARGLLVDDLHSYVRRFWPEASLSEARCVVQDAARYHGRTADARRVAVAVRNYENMMEDAAAKEAKSDTDAGGDNHDDEQNELTQPTKKRKGIRRWLIGDDER